MGYEAFVRGHQRALAAIGKQLADAVRQVTAEETVTCAIRASL